LSLLTRKSELASRLIGRDVDRAKLEINEVETIARDALGQIREVISGYRSSDITDELAQAKYVLESNDIRFEYELTINDMPENISQELGVILKELVTNVLKHTQASKAVANVSQTDKAVVLNFQDNGKKNKDLNSGGYGLQGIEERVNQLGGQTDFGFGQGANFDNKLLGFWLNIMVPTDD